MGHAGQNRQKAEDQPGEGGKQDWGCYILIAEQAADIFGLA